VTNLVSIAHDAGDRWAAVAGVDGRRLTVVAGGLDPDAVRLRRIEPSEPA
jgi:hypothetical protein